MRNGGEEGQLRDLKRIASKYNFETGLGSRGKEIQKQL